MADGEERGKRPIDQDNYPIAIAVKTLTGANISRQMNPVTEDASLVNGSDDKSRPAPTVERALPEQKPTRDELCSLRRLCPACGKRKTTNLFNPGSTQRRSGFEPCTRKKFKQAQVGQSSGSLKVEKPTRPFLKAISVIMDEKVKVGREQIKKT